MFSKKEIMFWVFVFIIGLLLAWSCRLEAREKVVLKEWTTQLLYDTTNACYQGTIKWVLMSNPNLVGQAPDWRSQRQMLEHCFCVMDRIRREISLEEYQKRVFEQVWVGNLFMSKAFECVKEEKTLSSFFVIQGDEKIKTVDNETKKMIPEELEDSKDELPSQKPKESEEDSTTIFQG